MKLSSETLGRIDKLRKELEKEYEIPYSREDLIETALTALEDVRNG